MKGEVKEEEEQRGEGVEGRGVDEREGRGGNAIYYIMVAFAIKCMH